MLIVWHQNNGVVSKYCYLPFAASLTVSFFLNIKHDARVTAREHYFFGMGWLCFFDSLLRVFERCNFNVITRLYRYKSNNNKLRILNFNILVSLWLILIKAGTSHSIQIKWFNWKEYFWLEMDDFDRKIYF